MNWNEFVTRVRAGAGDASEVAVEAALLELSRYVPAFDAKQFATSLPPRVVATLSDDAQLQQSEAPLAPPPHPEELSDGHAMELFGTVCRVIDEALDEPGQARFRRNLSSKLVATFDRADEQRNPPTGSGHEISDGRPGSNSPLAEANPAQANSIAREENPHSTTKLSGAEGVTQERKHRTLAEGEPGSTRPLSDHKP